MYCRSPGLITEPLPMVLVLKRAFQHVCHDLHVAVRVFRKTAAARNAVVVHHPQRAELHMPGIEVIGKRKGEMRIQPAVVRVPAFVALAYVNHSPPPGSCERIILVITTIVKRYICSPPRSPSPAPPALNQLFEFAHFASPLRPVSGGAPFGVQ